MIRQRFLLPATAGLLDRVQSPSSVHVPALNVGYGRIGETVCDELARAGVPFVVIERKEDACRDAVDAGYLVIQGNSTEDEVLNLARIRQARGVICVIDSDAENVFVTLCAREQNPDAFVACRANSRSAVNRLKRAGAAVVISPYTAAGLAIAGEILADRSNGPSQEDDGLPLAEFLDNPEPLVSELVSV